MEKKPRKKGTGIHSGKRGRLSLPEGVKKIRLDVWVEADKIKNFAKSEDLKEALSISKSEVYKLFQN
jgi:hypothetical protein